jgi:flagellar hook-associated protein 3 FlgL
MSGTLSISGQTYGPITQIIENASATSKQLDQVTEQASSGLVAQTFSGLGPTNAQTVLTVSPQISSMNAQIAELNAVTGPISVQQNALTQISSITTGIVSQLSSLNALNGSSTGTVIADAQSAFQQVASLLNTQDGNIYVFAGQDSGESPIPSAGNILSSGFYTQIQTAVAGLSSYGAAATSASILSIASSNAPGTTPFAAGLTTSVGLPSVTLSNGEQVTTGIAANSNAFVNSSGSTSTGAYMRDILAGLASIASLSPAQLGTSDFSTFVTTVPTQLTSANDTLNEDAGALGNIQSELTSKATAMQTTVSALTTQVGNADSVNMAATLSQLSSVQTALESSYRMIAAMKTLNLASYL